MTNLSVVLNQLSQHITSIESEPGYVLPADATFTTLTCSTLNYLDDTGTEIDLETEIKQWKTLNTSHSDEAKTSAENAATSARNAAFSASDARDSAIAANTHAGHAKNIQIYYNASGSASDVL